MEWANCCYNCKHAILDDYATWDMPAQFYGCMLNKDASVHRDGNGHNLDCFDGESKTEEYRKQIKLRRAEIIEEQRIQSELRTLARLKEKYEKGKIVNTIAMGEDMVLEDLDIECDYITIDGDTIYTIPKSTNRPIKIVKEDEWLMTLKGHTLELSRKLSPAEAEALIMSIFDTVDVEGLLNE